MEFCVPPEGRLEPTCSTQHKAVAIYGLALTGGDVGGSSGGVYALATNITPSPEIGYMDLLDATISGNRASESGGGIAFGGDALRVRRSTISRNLAGAARGGISGSALAVAHRTITGNHAGSAGGGIQQMYGSAAITHCIVAANTSGMSDELDDIAGRVSLSFSVVGVDAGATISDDGGNLIGNEAEPVDPKLGLLAYNGGPVYADGTRMQTHALLPGSPAIDAGDPLAMAGAPDGVVDENDYAWWKVNFGNVIAQGAGSLEQGGGAVGEGYELQAAEAEGTAGQVSSSTPNAKFAPRDVQVLQPPALPGVASVFGSYLMGPSRGEMDSGLPPAELGAAGHDGRADVSRDDALAAWVARRGGDDAVEEGVRCDLLEGGEAEVGDGDAGLLDEVFAALGVKI